MENKGEFFLFFLDSWEKYAYNDLTDHNYEASSAYQGVQIAGMIFQTGSSITHYIRACTGFDGGFEVVEAIRSLPNCVITGNSKYKR